jgi:hypothetical protein
MIVVTTNKNLVNLTEKGRFHETKVSHMAKKVCDKNARTKKPTRNQKKKSTTSKKHITQ